MKDPHHPDHIKQASISNTYPTICSIDALLKEAEQQSFKRRAIRNCYDSGYVDRVEQNSLKNVLVESRPYDKSCKDACKCPICLNSSASMPCSQKDVVYLMTCDLCGREAVGETSRPLVVRYKGRHRSAANRTAPSYKTWPFRDTTRSVTPHVSGSLHRKITEKLFIQKLKPKLNNKYEQLSVANFLV